MNNIINYWKNINERRRYYTLYTLIFAILIMISLSFVWFFHYSLTLYGDDSRGHYQWLLYFHDYYRDILRSIFINHDFNIKTYEFTLGYGNDILSTMSWAGIGDPLNLLAIFFPKEHMEYLFWLLNVLRLYISGITFSCYARSHIKHHSSVLLGAMTYCFSGFVLNAGFHQSTFINAILFFPLIMLGADNIFNKKDGRLFSISIGLLCICNFYWLYMTILIIIIYCVLYYITKELFDLKKLLKLISHFIFNGITGILMGSFILLPVVTLLSQSNRMGADTSIPVLYSFRYYIELLSHFFTTERNYSVYLGFSPIALAGLIILFARKSTPHLLKLMIIIMGVFLCIPFFAHIFNGFSYISNRWSFVLSFFVAYIVTITFSALKELSDKEKRILFFSTVIYAVVCISSHFSRTEWTMTGLMLATLYVMTIILYSNKKKRIITISAFLILITGIAVNVCYSCSYIEGNDYETQRYRLGECYEKMVLQNPAQLLHNIEDAPEHRADSYNCMIVNGFFQQGFSSPNIYCSTNNPYIGKFYDAVEYNSSSDFLLENMDYRSYLEALSGTKYYIIRQGDEVYLPYGFDKCIKTDVIDNTTYKIYENKYALPLMYCYNKTISETSWIQKDALTRQELLLESLIIDDENAPDYHINWNNSPEYFIIGNDRCTIDNNQIIVPEGNATITCQVTISGDEELYFHLEGLKYQEYESPKKYSGYKKYKKWIDDINHIPNEMASLNITADNGTSKSILYYTDKYYAYCGRDSYLCNLGYFDNSCTLTVTISLPNSGIYSFNKMGFDRQPMENYRKNIEILRNNSAHNIKTGTDYFRGSVNVKQDSGVFVSLPYSTGWKAYVDGNETPVRKSNGMYMSVPVTAGEHEIVFVYHTPGLKPGILLSAVGLLAFILYCMIQGSKGHHVSCLHENMYDLLTRSDMSK